MSPPTPTHKPPTPKKSHRQHANNTNKKNSALGREGRVRRGVHGAPPQRRAGPRAERRAPAALPAAGPGSHAPPARVRVVSVIMDHYITSPTPILTQTQPHAGAPAPPRCPMSSPCHHHTSKRRRPPSPMRAGRWRRPRRRRSVLCMPPACTYICVWADGYTRPPVRACSLTHHTCKTNK